MGQFVAVVARRMRRMCVRNANTAILSADSLLTSTHDSAAKIFAQSPVDRNHQFDHQPGYLAHSLMWTLIFDQCYLWLCDDFVGVFFFPGFSIAI